MAMTFEQELLVVLAGDIDQTFSQGMGQFGRGQPIIDKDPTPALAADNPAENAVFLVVQPMLVQKGQDILSTADAELGLNHGLVAIIAHPRGRGPSAGEQMHGLQNDGLPCPGLTGKGDQTGAGFGKIQI